MDMYYSDNIFQSDSKPVMTYLQEYKKFILPGGKNRLYKSTKIISDYADNDIPETMKIYINEVHPNEPSHPNKPSEKIFTFTNINGTTMCFSPSLISENVLNCGK